jgi:molybdopterin converting factor small subunit
MSKIHLNKNTTIIICIVGAIAMLAFANYSEQTKQTQNKLAIKAEANFEDLRSEKQKELDDLKKQDEINKLKKESKETEIKNLEIQFKIDELETGLKDNQPVQAVETKKELVVEPVKDDKTESPKEEPKPVVERSKYLDKWFNNKTGQTHWDICNSKEVGKKFIEAFAEFGADAQVIACVTLNHENGVVGGDYITNAVSPCWSTNAKQAQARQCDYASDNSAGVDAGLFMINTFYQANRITKLGGEACTFADSKNPKDPCNVKKITWLHNIDNQISIIKDIYREQGFQPWVAYLKHVKPYL